jgi:hypothetical protein
VTTGWLATLLKEQPNPFPLLAARGQMFNASAAAQNTTVTGATTFATTTPTFLLDVPADTITIPAYMSLNQAGTVAGGAVSVLMETDNADRYTSGGTAATVLNKLTTGGKSALSTLYSATGSAITATDAYGVRIMGLVTGQDVSPAEGVITEIVWTPTSGIELLVGPAAWLVYTYAAATGPTWLWSFSWAEIRTVDR